MHWQDGQPDRWAERTWRSVYWPVLLGALLNGLLIGLAWVILRSTRKTTMQFVTVGALQFLLYPVTFSFVLLSLIPLMRVPGWVIPSLTLVSIVVLLYWSYVETSANSGTNELPEPKHDSYWKAGIFYYNPSDSAIFVRKRVGIGYTMNFANKWAWAAVVAIVLVILIPMFFPR